MREFVINTNDGGQRLDKFITKSVKGLPVSLMYKFIRTKRIKVNGKRAEQKQMLVPGDTVQMYIPDEFFTTETADNELGRARVNLDIVYEDGAKEIIVTDTTWEVFTTEVLFTDIYHGETVDKTHTATKLGSAVLFEYKTKLVPQV